MEVLIGHGVCHIIAETSVHITDEEASAIVHRIADDRILSGFAEVPQDTHLADNTDGVHCGDNGIFKGMPVTEEQNRLTDIPKFLYGVYG